MLNSSFIISFIGSVILTNIVLNNVSTVVFFLINMFSRLQLRMCTKQKRIEHVNTDYNMDCLIGDSIVRFDSILNVVEKINQSDFAVISSGKYMICYYPQITEYTKEFEVSNVQFISVKIVIASVEYSIKMCSPDYSFYVVGNELNVEWVRYYFLKYKSISLSHDVRYILTILDDNVQFIGLSENDCVVLEKNKYQIHRYTENENEDDNDNDEDDNEDDNDEDDNDNDEDDVGLDRMIKIGEEIENERLSMIEIENERLVEEYNTTIEIENERLVEEYNTTIEIENERLVEEYNTTIEIVMKYE
jgi:hypothetical protein